MNIFFHHLKLEIALAIPASNEEKKNKQFSSTRVNTLNRGGRGRHFKQNLERDMTQWLERGALSMSLPAVRFRIPLGVGFLGICHVSSLAIFGHCFDVVSLGKALSP